MIFKSFQEDIDAFLARDPAARSRIEVVLCYPGFHALLFYRATNVLWRNNWHLLARFISMLSKILTAIEIHPGARIGRRFVIDHGIGVVIGETSDIGDDVTIYQGVTLGGVAPSIDSQSQVNQKRHPTLGNDVIIGAGAQILGPITIGDGARIGANSVVHKDIPAGVTAVGIPARVVMPRDKQKANQFVAYGEPVDGCPDPVLRTIEDLRHQVTALMGHVEELESRLEGGAAGNDKSSGGADGINEKTKAVAGSGNKP
ncbi:MAG: serine O-acetyltransferase [Rhodospirillaceae bacterium]|nr:serine O-acetyltransferase [Rhodospirillaceae bacterium]